MIRRAFGSLWSTGLVLTGLHPYGHGPDLTGGGNRNLGVDAPGHA